LYEKLKTSTVASVLVASGFHVPRQPPCKKVVWFVHVLYCIPKTLRFLAVFSFLELVSIRRRRTAHCRKSSPSHDRGRRWVQKCLPFFQVCVTESYALVTVEVHILSHSMDYVEPDLIKE